MKFPLIFTNLYSRSMLMLRIKDYFSPQQHWLTRVIPNKWTDKCELVPLVLFTILIDFVEGEDGLSQLDVDWTADIAAGHVTMQYVAEVKKSYNLLRLAYNYAKSERAELNSRMMAAYPQSSSFKHITSATYEETYAEVEHLEKIISDRDQWAMGIIIKHVDILWT